MFKKLRNRVGYRGSFLLFLALLDGLYSYALWNNPAPNLKGVLSFHVWAVLWVVGCVFALAGAFMKIDRIPFGAVTVLKFGWATLWIRVWIFNKDFRWEAWQQAVLWLSFTAITFMISFWPEPHSPEIIKNIDVSHIKRLAHREKSID